MKKRLLSFVLCLAMLVPAVFSGMLTAAADGLDENDYCADISEYRGGEQETWSYPTKDGYVFAGWYQDAERINPVSESTVSGGAYARFVVADVLSVKYQLNALANIADDTVNLRMLTSVDSLSYQSVGFRFQTGGPSSSDFMTTMVYTSILADGATVLPSVFSEESHYILGRSLNNIPKSNFGSTFTITPMWVTLDGTTVLGTARTLTLNEDFKVAADRTLTYNGSHLWFWFNNVKIYANQYISFDLEGLPLGTGVGSVKYYIRRAGSNTDEEAFQCTGAGAHPGKSWARTQEGDKLHFYGKVYGDYSDTGYSVGIQLFNGNGAASGDSITVSNLQIVDQPEDILYYNFDCSETNSFVPVNYYNGSGPVFYSISLPKNKVLSFKVAMEYGKIANPSSPVVRGGHATGDWDWSSLSVVDNPDGTQTVEVRIPGNSNFTKFYPQFAVQNIPDGVTENRIAISDIRVNDFQNGYYVGATRPTWTWNTSASAGDTLTFDLESEQPITIQCKLNGSSWSTISWKKNLKGKITVTAVFTADVSAIEMLAAESYLWASVPISLNITNVKITKAS